MSSKMRTRRSADQAKAVSELADQSLKEQRELIEFDLECSLELEDNIFVRSLYQDHASDSAIYNFLKKSRFYNLKQHRWKLPHSFSNLIDGNTCAPFCNIVSSIVKHFWGDATAEGTRQVVDTHATDLPHLEAKYPGHTSRPSIAIKAEGPSFQLPQTKTGDIFGEIGFSNVAACIEIQVVGDELKPLEQAARVGIYARQIFLKQPNRKFARMLFLSEQHVRLFHFDRSGIQYTQPIDYHEEPEIFIRLVLGLSSPNESDLGLDTSIQWEIKHGRKVSGTVTTREGDTDKVYPLQYLEPVVLQTYVCSKGTTCWSVTDAETGEELLIKDYWRRDEWTFEGAHLRRVLGAPGVTQMISCEENRETTRELRGYKEGDIVPEDFYNRTCGRIVMETYGLPLSVSMFADAKQLLCVFRDAIAGHQEMLKAGSLHRNISQENIVHGKPGAKPGNRGILVDFVRATSYDPENMSGTQTDWTIGHPKYQSVMALLSESLGERALVHDDNDDLEAFLYVYAFIIHERDSFGERHPLGQADPLRLWIKYEENPKFVAKLKRNWLEKLQDSLPEDIEERWPKECLEILKNFKAYMNMSVNSLKIRLLKEEPLNKEWLLEELRLSYEKHYRYVLGFFDDGIEALERAEAAAAEGNGGDDDDDGDDDDGDDEDNNDEDDDAPPSPCPPPGAGGSRLKRRREDEDEDQLPHAKRLTSESSWHDPTNPFL